MVGLLICGMWFYSDFYYNFFLKNTLIQIQRFPKKITVFGWVLYTSIQKWITDHHEQTRGWTYVTYQLYFVIENKFVNRKVKLHRSTHVKIRSYMILWCSPESYSWDINLFSCISDFRIWNKCANVLKRIDRLRWRDI